MRWWSVLEQFLFVDCMVAIRNGVWWSEKDRKISQQMGTLEIHHGTSLCGQAYYDATQDWQWGRFVVQCLLQRRAWFFCNVINTNYCLEVHTQQVLSASYKSKDIVQPNTSVVDKLVKHLLLREKDHASSRGFRMQRMVLVHCRQSMFLLISSKDC